MSKSEIQSWIASTSTSDENGDMTDTLFWRRDRVLNEWPQALEYAQSRLMTSKTKIRIQFLRDELLSLAKHGGESISLLLLEIINSNHPLDLNLSQTLDVFNLLTHTYPRYVDTLSREAVEAVGMELVRRDELRGTPQGAVDENQLGVTEQISGWLMNEVSHVSKRGLLRFDQISIYLLR